MRTYSLDEGMRNLLLRAALIAVLLGLGGARIARAIQVKVSAQALERTLRTQLFNGPEGRYYMRGNATSACYVYAESPHVTFKDDRVVVHVHTKAKLGTALHGALHWRDADDGCGCFADSGCAGRVGRAFATRGSSG